MSGSGPGGRVTPTRSWWSPPAAFSFGSDYAKVVALAAGRDSIALKLPPIDRLPPVPLEVHPLARRMTHIGVQIEDVGGAAAEALLAADVPVELRGGLKRATWDEVRHSELLHRLDETIDDEPTPDRALGVDTVVAELNRATTALEFAVVHVVLESQASDLFRVVAHEQRHNALGQVYAVINADEHWHVELGMAVVAHLGRSASHAERAEALDRAQPVFATAPQANEATLGFICSQLGLDVERTRAGFAQRHRVRVAQLRTALRLVDEPVDSTTITKGGDQ